MGREDTCFYAAHAMMRQDEMSCKTPQQRHKYDHSQNVITFYQLIHGSIKTVRVHRVYLYTSDESIHFITLAYTSTNNASTCLASAIIRIENYFTAFPKSNRVLGLHYPQTMPQKLYFAVL